MSPRLPLCPAPGLSLPALLCLAVAATVGASRAAAAPPQSAEAVAARSRIVTVRAGTSAASARTDARRALPLASLAPADRGRAAAILDSHSLFRTLPRLRFPIHPDSLDYFVQHPDVSVALWRVLEISVCELYQTGPATFEADAHDGSLGLFEVVHNGPHDQVVLVEGQFKSPVLSDPIEATALFHLRTQSVMGTDGTPYAVGEASLFVAFPSRAVGTAAKLISPVTNVILDRNFEEVCLFAHLMDRSMATRPLWVESLAVRMDGVLPRRKAELTRLAGHVYAAAQRRAGVRVADRPR